MEMRKLLAENEDLKQQLSHETNAKNEEFRKRKITMKKFKEFKNYTKDENKVLTDTMARMDEEINNLDEQIKVSQERAKNIQFEGQLQVSEKQAKIIELEEQLKVSQEQAENVQLEGQIQVSEKEAKIIELEEQLKVSQEQAENVQLEGQIQVSEKEAKIIELEEQLKVSQEQAENVQLEGQIQVSEKEAKIIQLEEQLKVSQEQAENVQLEGPLQVSEKEAKIIELEDQLRVSREQGKHIHRQEQLKVSQQQAKIIRLEKKLRASREELKVSEDESANYLASFHDAARKVASTERQLQFQLDENKRSREEIDSLLKYKQNYRERSTNYTWIMEELDELERVTTHFSFRRRISTKRALIYQLKDLIGRSLKMRYNQQDNAGNQGLRLKR